MLRQAVLKSRQKYKIHDLQRIVANMAQETLPSNGTRTLEASSTVHCFIKTKAKDRTMRHRS